jgi:hypothetical protein
MEVMKILKSARDDSSGGRGSCSDNLGVSTRVPSKISSAYEAVERYRAPT